VRTPAVLGASLLLLASLAATSPAAATNRVPWEGPHDSRTGASWDGGSAVTGGTTYSWHPSTRSWQDNTCPDMDQPKKDTSGSPKTVVLEAPAGKLISAYCVKSGSAKQGEGPKIVVLDEPVATLTIAYPTGGKCKAISHYAVAYVDAPPVEETTPPVEETDPPVEETTPPVEETAPPVEETDPPVEETTPPVEETTPPVVDAPEPVEEEAAAPAPSALPTAPPDGSAPGMGGPDYAEAVPAIEEAPSINDGTSLGRVPQDAAVTPESLPVTGPQVVGLVMAAVALVGAGMGALMWTRQRRAA